MRKCIILGIVTVCAAVVSMMGSIPVCAQVTSTVTQQRHDLSFSMGRDFWLAEMSNEWGSPAYALSMELFISSPKNTVAHIAFVGKSDSLITDSVIVKGDSMSTFSLPASIQMQRSGVVENKAIHVWSDDAPLTVYNLNSITTSSSATEGEYLIPTIGWDTEYVVGAYESLYYSSTGVFSDLPSEMAVVASQDSTVVSITPSCKCRFVELLNGKPDTLILPEGQATIFTLNRGQSLQLMPIVATSASGFDMTGTIVHATHPVGVFGGSMQPNIPYNYPTANRVEDMIPSARTWGENYVVSGSALYLFVASQPGQTIYAQSCESDRSIAATLYNSYTWLEYEDAATFSSSAPFLCMEYYNSSSYPIESGLTPGESAMNSVEQFTSSVPFVTPMNTNYAVITVNKTDVSKLELDGKPLSLTARCADFNWTIGTTQSLPSGNHVITDLGDSGIGVHIYGYGSGTFYSASSPAFEGTFHSTDTTSPIASIVSNCTGAMVSLTDMGLNATGIAAVWLDSISNGAFLLDTTFHEGVPHNSTSFSFAAKNLMQAASMQATVYDVAGNSTTVTLHYSSTLLTIREKSVTFDSMIVGAPRETMYDTILNLTRDTITIASLSLSDTTDFAVGSGSTILLPDSQYVFSLTYNPSHAGKMVDTLFVTTICTVPIGTMTGYSVAPNWSVSGATWENVPFPTAPLPMTVTIQNNMPLPFTVTSAKPDSSEFTVDTTAFPLAIAKNDIGQFTMWFEPKFANQTISVALQLQSSEAGDGMGTLKVLGPSGVTLENAEPTVLFVRSLDGRNIQIIVPASWPNATHVELLNTLGQTVFSGNIPGSTTLDVGSLPRGVYFYRLNAGSVGQIGKILLGK